MHLEEKKKATSSVLVKTQTLEKLDIILDMQIFYTLYTFYSIFA